MFVFFSEYNRYEVIYSDNRLKREKRVCWLNKVFFGIPRKVLKKEHILEEIRKVQNPKSDKNNQDESR